MESEGDLPFVDFQIWQKMIKGLNTVKVEAPLVINDAEFGLDRELEDEDS